MVPTIFELGANLSTNTAGVTTARSMRITRTSTYTGPKPLVSHYNNQYDLVQGTLLQYLRTSDARWFDLCDSLARHVIDIDIYRTTRIEPHTTAGSSGTPTTTGMLPPSTHRCYSRANRGSAGRRYGGGPCNEHNYTTGLLHYYYLTGNPQARDTVLGLADWVIAMDDGRRTVLGLIDAGATGSASSTTEPGYHGPGRGCGNSVNALLDAWLLTCDRGYLDKAEQLIRRVVHPATNIAEPRSLERGATLVLYGLPDRAGQVPWSEA